MTPNQITLTLPTAKALEVVLRGSTTVREKGQQVDARKIAVAGRLLRRLLHATRVSIDVTPSELAFLRSELLGVTDWTTGEPDTVAELFEAVGLKLEDDHDAKADGDRGAAGADAAGGNGVRVARPEAPR